MTVIRPSFLSASRWASPDLTRAAKRAYYNIYSLQRTHRRLEELGFAQARWEKFELDIDLPRPANGSMGTYTKTTKEGERLQISGPLLMPWYFVYAKKE